MTHQFVVYLSFPTSTPLSCYCKGLEIVTFMEEGGTASTVESSVPSSNSNENENLGEEAGDNFVSLLPPFYYATMI